MSEKDGGPAFPLQDWDEAIHSKRNSYGMPLRDWFAGKALQGIIQTGAKAYPGTEIALKIGKIGIYQWRAETAYKYADAMLVERCKSNADHKV